MPLDKSGSKESFGNNVKAEMGAGKPQKQAVAIAYSVQRERKPRKGDGVGKEVSEHMHKIKNGLRT